MQRRGNGNEKEISLCNNNYINPRGTLLLLRGFSGEDSWIKDSNGIWIKHGNPSETPDYVLEQQKALLNCASNKLDNYGNCLK